MTKDQLEEYITKLLPSFRKKYVKSADDDDLCQLAIVDLYKKHETLEAKDDNEFTKLFLSFYGSWQFHKRSTIAKAIHNSNYLMPFMGDRQGSIEIARGYNPWETVQVQALEYLQFVTNPKIQAIMYMHYIEGYSQVEIAKVYGISKLTVFHLIGKGITKIQRIIAENS